MIPNPPESFTDTTQLNSLVKIFENFTSHLSLTLPGTKQGDANATSNWAGYVAMADAGSTASYVNGTWTMPTLSCNASSNSGVFFWVGLGGVSGAPLEQIGTMGFCLGGQPTYGAWYEAVPTDDHIILLNNTAPSAGQEVSASVTYSSSTGQFTYQIGVSGQAPYTFSQSYANVGAPMSAEWVVEPPFMPVGPVTMANFGSVSFLAYATIGGQTGGPASFSQSSDAYLIRTSYLCGDQTAKALPAQNSGSSSFTVTWSGGDC
jgi:hypothetical protein